MDSQGKKRQRCVSFSSEEKLLIANICAKYKHILENKKTDYVTSEEKNKTWKKIASEVNSAAINSSFRSIDVLKRFYDNRKREVRKLAAEEKKEVYGTGGGPYIKFKKDACHDIILTAMNSKTVYGLENEFDGDAEPLPVLKELNCSMPNIQENTLPCNEIEIVYESVEADKVDNEKHTMTWKKYIPTDLKRPITSNLINLNEEDAQPSTSTTIIDNDNEETNINTTPETRKRSRLPPSRRRPTLEIKALTRSELAEKYDKLIDKRLEITEFQKRKIQELLTIEGKRKLKYQLLELQIEVEKEKLKQFRAQALID